MDSRRQQWLPVRRCVRVSVLMAVALATAISVAAPATAETAPPAGHDPGSLGIRILDVPAGAADDPRAESYVVDELQPGATIQRRVQISNTTASQMAVDVYAAAAGVADGAFVVADGRTANGLSSWTTPSVDSVQVPPDAAVDVTVTVAVPADAPPGEQYAVIWASTAGPGDGNILAVSRVGVRMYVAVLGDNPLASAFVISGMLAERTDEGHGAVRAAVENTGDRALDLSGGLTMSAVGKSVSAGPYPATLGTTLAPGQSGTVVFEIADDVEVGPWDAVVELHSGLVTAGYEAQVTFPARADGAVSAPVPTPSGGLPWWEIALGALVLAALGGLLLSRRRRPSRAAHRDSAE